MELITDKMLAESSRNLYNKKLAQFVTFMPKGRQSVDFIVDNPGLAVPILLDEKSIAQTNTNLHMFFSSVVAYIQHTDKGRSRSDRIKRKWLEIQKNNWESYRQIELGELSEKDKIVARAVKWSDLINVRNHLPKGSYERLLLSVYTFIPPLRADFFEVRINPPQSLIKSKKTNYIQINSKSATLVIRDFKTASKYKAITHELQPEFVKEINESLEYEPRKYLFVMPSDITRPYDRNGFSKWANKVLQEIYKVPITLTSLRHIFISTLDFSKMRVLEMEKIAHQMGHSLGMQKQYQWLDDEE
jgi:hypothetical protein